MSNTMTVLGDLSGVIEKFNEYYCIVKIHGTNDSVKFYRYDLKNNIDNEWLWKCINQNKDESTGQIETKYPPLPIDRGPWI